MRAGPIRLNRPQCSEQMIGVSKRLRMAQTDQNALPDVALFQNSVPQNLDVDHQMSHWNLKLYIYIWFIYGVLKEVS